MSLYGHSQVSKTIDVTTSGNLSTLLTDDEKNTITNLTLTGIIDVRDIKCIRDQMPVIANLDLSSANIVAYSGEAITYPSLTSYPVNEMPAYSFRNPYTGQPKATLSSVKLPNSLLSIGESAFSSCTGLKSITIGNSVKTIGKNSFFYCTGLNTVIMGSSVTTIGDDAFDNCFALSDLTIGNHVTSIGFNSFYSCQSLTNILIPNTVTTIGTSAFSHCSGITTLTIGNSVTYIEVSAFSACTSFKTIYCLNVIPPTCQVCFSGTTGVTAVYVPTLSVSAYKSAAVWSDSFYSVIRANDNYGITVQIGSGGSIKENNVTLINGSLLSVVPGTKNEFTMVPNAGYELETIVYDGVDIKSQVVNNIYITPNVNYNTILSVTFKTVQYRITLKDALNGTMDLLCEYGASPSFEFTPSLGWKINTVHCNDNDITSSLVNGVYNVPAISDNVVLNVSFVSTESGAPELICSKVKVYSTKSEIIIEGISEGEIVNIYTINGKHLKTVESLGDRIVIPTQSSNIYLVKTTNKMFKVIL